jgi:hypothetical protein
MKHDKLLPHATESGLRKRKNKNKINSKRNKSIPYGEIVERLHIP